MTTVVDTTYSMATAAIPMIVARGIVLDGLTTLPAGTVPDSRPRKEKRVIVAARLTALNALWPAGKLGARLPGWK